MKAFDSSCSKDEFTCGNGACIDIDSRCDNINDCVDRSDEAECSRIKKDPTYQKFIVPPPNEGEEKLEVKVSISLLKILDIRYFMHVKINSARVDSDSDSNLPIDTHILSVSSEVSGSFEVQFILKMQWLETRLLFKNLKKDVTLNNLSPSEMTSIWVPKVIFSNTVTKPSTIVDEETMMYVEKQGDYEQSSIEDVENVRYYGGHENQLHMQRFYNQK